MSIVAAPYRRPPARKPNEVIVSGPENQVDTLLTRVHRWIRNPAPVLASYTADRMTYKVVLIKYDQEPTCDETEKLNDDLLKEARNAGLAGIHTEPNCTVAAPPGWRGDPYPWEGSPYPWEGSPYPWEGSPYEWEGSPLSRPTAQGQQKPPIQVKKAGASPAQGADLFADQDAFRRIQVAVGGKRNPLLDAYTGEKVLVALFDSCPSTTKLAKLKGGAPNWLHTYSCKSPEPLDSGTFVDHGLFNASLIHFIAPSADIHLYQVLDGEMFGETAWLIAALDDFLKLAGDQPTVVNLSLGSACCGNGSMPAVEGILWELVRRGGVICAAAGNKARKARKPAAIPPSQMPAALPYVIAVAASNRQTIRASYSQRGDIAAPGGDTMGEGPDGFDDIIGMGTSSPTGYIRMDCGTSFATPLAAGAAALALSDLMKRGAPHDSGLWRRVMDRLALSALQPMGAEGTLNTTGLGAGIIQVSGHRLVPNG
jgi:hypothetical protein